MKTFYHAGIILTVFLLSIKTYSQNANTTLSNLVSPTKVNVDLLPDNSNTHNLGSPNKAWKNIYIKGFYYLNGNRFIKDSGTENTFIGSNAGNSNTGHTNSANGYHALYSNT